ncbi:hypothetical protein HHI36_021967 [Cryptolaemus montrouzieri]|uniref:Uncharacterized protein n=1 Tax=Cryptolaemus montrouzieri TaxID=559131 RepID=A0ABD2MYN2_9CUCU
MDLFNSEEDMDEFFKEEPNFCSTQISEKCPKDKQNISSSKSVNAKMDCDNTKKEHTQIWENMFEGVDANSLFDDFRIIVMKIYILYTFICFICSIDITHF